VQNSRSKLSGCAAIVFGSLLWPRSLFPGSRMYVERSISFTHALSLCDVQKDVFLYFDLWALCCTDESACCMIVWLFLFRFQSTINARLSAGGPNEGKGKGPSESNGSSHRRPQARKGIAHPLIQHPKQFLFFFFFFQNGKRTLLNDVVLVLSSTSASFHAVLSCLPKRELSPHLQTQMKIDRKVM